MSPNKLTDILRLATKGKLPRVVDETTPEALTAVRQLYQTGLIHAINASADDGYCYLEPEITLAGRIYLKMHCGSSRADND
jgi:hypothetical protein